MSEIQILAATDKAGSYFLVKGRATFACCTDFRNYAEKLLAGSFDSVCINLAECTGMDSTFMGVLAMMGLDRLKKQQQKVQIINAPDNCEKLLGDLGLKKLFEYCEETDNDHKWLSIYPTDDRQRPTVITLEGGRLMLQAHQTLMDVDKGNVGKFKDVVDHLAGDVAGMEEDSK